MEGAIRNDYRNIYEIADYKFTFRRPSAQRLKNARADSTSKAISKIALPMSTSPRADPSPPRKSISRDVASGLSLPQSVGTIQGTVQRNPSPYFPLKSLVKDLLISLCKRKETRWRKGIDNSSLLLSANASFLLPPSSSKFLCERLCVRVTKRKGPRSNRRRKS